MPHLRFILTPETSTPLPINDYIFKIQSISPKDDTYEEIHSVSLSDINEHIREYYHLYGFDFTFFTFLLDTIRNVWYDQNK